MRKRIMRIKDWNVCENKAGLIYAIYAFQGCKLVCGCVCVCVPQMECWRGDTASFSVRLPHQQGVVRRAFANK